MCTEARLPVKFVEERFDPYFYPTRKGHITSLSKLKRKAPAIRCCKDKWQL